MSDPCVTVDNVPDEPLDMAHFLNTQPNLIQAAADAPAAVTALVGALDPALARRHAR